MESNDDRYFWRSSKYKYDTLMQTIKEIELEDKLSNEEFVFLKYNYQSTLNDRDRNAAYSNNNSDDKVYDDISSFLLFLNEAEQLNANRQIPFFENKEIIIKSKIKNYSHKNIDLHGFTQNGARQEVRRVLCNLDRKKKNMIKFNVGKGKHSHKLTPILPSIVNEVCESLGFHKPSVSEKNQGYLQITIDPIISED